jgi:hypothetical protein
VKGSTLCPTTMCPSTLPAPNVIESATKPVGRATPAHAMRWGVPSLAETPELWVFPTISSCHRTRL